MLPLWANKAYPRLPQSPGSGPGMEKSPGERGMRLPDRTCPGSRRLPSPHQPVPPPAQTTSRYPATSDQNGGSTTFTRDNRTKIAVDALLRPAKIEKGGPHPTETAPASPHYGQTSAGHGDVSSSPEVEPSQILHRPQP